MLGGIRSAAALAKSSWLVGGSSGTSVLMDGVTVTVVGGSGSTAGYPTNVAVGITAAMQSIDGFTGAYGALATFTPTGYTPVSGGCRVEYNLGVASAITDGC